MMIAAHRGHKEVVQLLLEHEPALQDLDKFGKTAADKAQSTAIAALIQSSLLKAQFAEQRGGRDARPRFFSPRKSMPQLSKPSGRSRPIQKSPRRPARKLVGNLVQSVGASRARELLDGFMEKMKRKVSTALDVEVGRELGEQLEKADASLQKSLLDHFCQQRQATIRHAVQVFNSKMEEALKKRGLEFTADLRLESDDVAKLLQDSDVDCQYIIPNPTLMTTLKTSSSKRPLSPPGTRTRPDSSEPQLGLDLIGFLGTQFEQMSSQLRRTLATAIAGNMQEAFGQLKTVYLASNKTSFDFLKRDLSRKLDTTLKEKLTRAELRHSTARTQSKRGLPAPSESLSPSRTERAQPAHRSLWTGTFGSTLA